MIAKIVKLPKGYTPSTKEEYMNTKQLEYFKQKLTFWRDELVEESRETINNLQAEVRDVGDEAERATRETENSLELRTRDRYRKLIARKPVKRSVFSASKHVQSRLYVSMPRSVGKFAKNRWVIRGNLPALY